MGSFLELDVNVGDDWDWELGTGLDRVRELEDGNLCFGSLMFSLRKDRNGAVLCTSSHGSQESWAGV